MKLLCRFVIGCCSLLVVQARAQQAVLSGNEKAWPQITVHIPAGYDTLSQGTAYGDFDGDGRADVVLALRNTVAEQKDWAYDKGPARLLLVLKNTGNGYSVWVQSKTALLCKTCGGAQGDPFASLAADSGVIRVLHMGGSNWRFEKTDIFQYRKGAFYRIGATRALSKGWEDCSEVFPYPAAYDYTDTNLLTGERERVKTSADCEMLLNKKDKIKVLPLQRLERFKIEN